MALFCHAKHDLDNSRFKNLKVEVSKAYVIDCLHRVKYGARCFFALNRKEDLDD